MTTAHDMRLEVKEAQPGVVYSLEAAAGLTGVPRRTLLVYCKSGLVRPAGGPPEGALTFDDEALYRIRRVEHFRAVHGINLAGIRMIFDLMNELERLQEEIRFLRS